MGDNDVPIAIKEGVYIMYNSGGVYTFADIGKLGKGFDALWKPYCKQKLHRRAAPNRVSPSSHPMRNPSKIQSNTATRSLFNELPEDLKKKNVCLADNAVQTLLNAANSRILEELKASRIAYPEEKCLSASSSNKNLPRGR